MDKEEMLLLDNQLCFLLYACSRGITRIYRPLLEKLELTYPQYLVLLVLWEKDGLGVNEIGAKLHLDSGTLTPLLKRLQTAGIVQKRRSKKDERKVAVYLTKKGAGMKQEALNIPEALFCQSGMTIDQYLTLKVELEKLLRQVETSTRESGVANEQTV